MGTRTNAKLLLGVLDRALPLKTLTPVGFTAQYLIIGLQMKDLLFGQIPPNVLIDMKDRRNSIAPIY